MFCIANLLDVINPQKVKKTQFISLIAKKNGKCLKYITWALHCTVAPPLYFSLTLFNRKAADSGSVELVSSTR